MDVNWHEWLNLILRWFHILAAISWIGATYLFNWIERNLEQSLTGSQNLSEVWMVHGGGFWIFQKQKTPELFPRKLHWFMWESLLTWLSGFLLLIVVYYTGGVNVTLDSGVSETTGILVGIGSLGIGWLFYEGVWSSPLQKYPRIAVVLCFIGTLFLAYGLTFFLSSRSVFLHVGAVFGTVMMLNVWKRILPAQRQMIAAMKAGTEVDSKLAKRASRCSKHNTYLSVPLVLLMISNHYPTATYGHDHSLWVLGFLICVGFGGAKLIRDVL